MSTPADPRAALKRRLKRTAGAAALLAALAGGAVFGQQYWTHGRFLESTDDAYVKADYTVIAPKVSGYISQVLVGDNQKVTAGTVLARIDDRDLRAALDQATANVEAAQSAIAGLSAEITQQQAVVDQQKAAIAAAEASLTFASQDHKRYAKLVKTGYGTVQQFQKAEATLLEKTAELQQSKAALLAARQKLTVLATERGKAQAERDRALALSHQAELKLSYTNIVAPVDGTVGARAVRVGQYVQAGTRLMAVVPLHAVYVVANFKETQLTRVRAGQAVSLSVDGYPDVALKGKVDSLSPASGLEFALLPPDNATGNFTKIVQRVPVKIVLDDDSLAGLLRPGMSVETTIDTKGAPVVTAARAHKEL